MRVAQREVELGRVAVEEAVDDLGEAVAGRVGLRRDPLEPDPVDPLGDQHPPAAERGLHPRDRDERVPAPEAGDAPVVGGLELVVALLGHALGELGEQVLDVEPRHQPPEDRREQAQVAHVGLDGLGDPGVLDLDGKLLALVRARAVDLADARGGGRLGIDLGEHVLGRLAPLALEHLAHLFPRDGRDVVAKRREPLLQVRGLVGVEAGELDRRQDLSGLHRGTSHDGELVDQCVDRRHHPVAAPALALLVGAARVEPVARPARGAAGGHPPEHRRPRGAALGRSLALRFVGASGTVARASSTSRSRGGGRRLGDRAAPSSQPRAEQDQRQPDERSGARVLVEHGDAADDRDHRGDVGDHQRAPGPDLDHQRGVDGERGRGAEQAKHHQRHDRLGRGGLRRGIERRRRRQDERGDGERRAHRRPRVEVGEMALEHHRPDRVAERREQDRGRAQQLVAVPRHVDADQRHDAEQADQESREPRAGDPLGGVEAQGEQSDEQRRRGDDDRRERGRDVLFAGRDHREGDRDLDHGEDRQPPPATAHGGEQAEPPGEREQDRRPEHYPGPGEEGGGDAVVDGDLDEEVRDPPEDRDGRERRPGARAHARQPGDSSPRITWRSTEPGTKTSTEYWTASRRRGASPRSSRAPPRRA